MVVRRLLILFLLAGLASLVAACGASDGDRGAGALVTGDIAPRDDDDEEPESVLGPPSAPTQSTVPPAFEPLEAPPPAAADAGPTVDSEPAPPEPASPAKRGSNAVVAYVAADLEPGRLMNVMLKSSMASPSMTTSDQPSSSSNDNPTILTG